MVGCHVLSIKAALAILVAAFALLCFGCGGDDAEVTTEEAAAPAKQSEPPENKSTAFPPVIDPDDPRFSTITTEGGPRAEPEIDPPDGASPPKELLLRDLATGSGPRARPGDLIDVRYVGVDYLTGKERYTGWPQTLAVQLWLDGNTWEKGFWGMREGGRREMVIPALLSFSGEPLNYVVEVVKIESGSS